MRRGVPELALAATLVILVGCGSDGTAGAPARDEVPVTAEAPEGARNVVLITLDGLRQDHLALFGYERETSPNLDRLGRAGLRFRTIVPSSDRYSICVTARSGTTDRSSVGYTRDALPSAPSCHVDGGSSKPLTIATAVPRPDRPVDAAFNASSCT